MDTLSVLVASKRTASGKGGARALRRNEQVPCVVYGVGSDVVLISLDKKTVLNHCLKSDFLSRIINLSVEGENIAVLPKEVQFHPVTDMPLHVDFLRVNETSEVKVNVPVLFINEEKSPALKLGAILNVVKRSVRVLCTHMAVPEKFEIDLTGAKVGTIFTINDLTLPAGCRLHQSTKLSAILANIAQTGKQNADAGTSAA
ncbi:MAG: 50S ribosomal protein L25/general stress protein Ctc [Holosporales bacterium]|jgi:large subunit ribosomal protein L25|nr:50S ribosomal protein L25/general stress protein Ctc [Holosporales bacterium]